MANGALRIRFARRGGSIYPPASRSVPRVIRIVQSAGLRQTDGNLLFYRPVVPARAEVFWFGRERARTAGVPGPFFRSGNCTPRDASMRTFLVLLESHRRAEYRTTL